MVLSEALGGASNMSVHSFPVPVTVKERKDGGNHSLLPLFISKVAASAGFRLSVLKPTGPHFVQ